MRRAVVVLSGGLDSVCAAALLKPDHEMYGMTFSYGQRAGREVEVAESFAERLGLRQHKIVDIGFMKELYGDSNVLTGSRRIPEKFEYSIVVPVRNAVFLSIASAWAFTLDAGLVAYGAHTGDTHYPDCSPVFAEKLQAALNQGEVDGIRSGIRRGIKIWSPYGQGLSKGDLLKSGISMLGDSIFDTWSCYKSMEAHCGTCESCNNRKEAFAGAGIRDKTAYLA